MNQNRTKLYTREKKLTLAFDGVTRDFIFFALSARDQEMAIIEAQEIHADTVRKLSGAEESIKKVYLLQDRELLIDEMLLAEQDRFLSKAVLTLAGDEPDYQEKMVAKAEMMKQSRRLEVAALTKEQLAEKLTSIEMNRQLQASWSSANLEAMLAKTLHNEEGQYTFASVAEMKQAMPYAALEKLYEALVEFLIERGNAQVFLKPHTLNG